MGFSLFGGRDETKLASDEARQIVHEAQDKARRMLDAAATERAALGVELGELRGERTFLSAQREELRSFMRECEQEFHEQYTTYQEERLKEAEAKNSVLMAAKDAEISRLQDTVKKLIEVLPKDIHCNVPNTLKINQAQDYEAR